MLLRTCFRALAMLILAGWSMLALVDARGQDPTDPKDPPVAEEKKEFKRIKSHTDEDLRKQLQVVAEIGFDQQTVSMLYAPLIKFSGEGAPNIAPDLGQWFYRQLAAKLKRSDLTAVSWRTGLDCQMGKEHADRLQVLSVALRNNLRNSVTIVDSRPDPQKLKALLQSGKGRSFSQQPKEEGVKSREWSTPEALPTLLQMLQAENTPVRMLLVDMIADIDGKEASAALAQRALFDLAPTVREKAVEALAARPAKEFKHLLMEGFRWPWPAVAEHAAEAIHALKLAEALPELVALLSEPDPTLPFPAPKAKGKTHLLREVVKVNHMSNCMLCHAPSFSKDDPVRGRVPMPGEDPPPLYYQATTGLFVRADITYLKQDFSVMQPVVNNGKWPGNQRFDYLMRTRVATPQELKLYQQLKKDNKLTDAFPQRDAVLFALREMTQTDRGRLTDDWIPLLKAIEKQQP